MKALVVTLAALGCTHSDKTSDAPGDGLTGSESADTGRGVSSDPPEDCGFPEEPYVELRSQGVDRYLGRFEPASSVPASGGGTAHAFDSSDGGPVCMEGGTFYTMTKDRGSDDLVIFLQGGGLCYSELCIAIASGGPHFVDIDILSEDPETNPTAGFNQVYVPYCDGSLFGGDADTDDNGDGAIDRRQRGLQNISAAVDVAHAEFPNPRRIVLAGSSGGGYGTIIATMLVRWTWPDALIYVVNDSGVGLGLAGDSSFIEGIMEEFNAGNLIPNSALSIIDDGHLTGLIDWQLGQDSQLRVAAISHLTDYVISQIYLDVRYAEFEDALRDETDELQSAWPGRYEYFLPHGSQHTALLGDASGFVDPDDPYAILVGAFMGSMADTEVDDLRLADWLRQFIDDDPEWESHAD